MDKKSIVENFVREAYEKGVFTGTWLYAEHGDIVSKGAVGFRDSGDTLPMKEDCIFYLASIAKQFTASAIMLLIRNGLLSLDDAYYDRVRDCTVYFPEYYPDGDYHFFVSKEWSFGLYGHPWKKN